jgi:hypothetical protein
MYSDLRILHALPVANEAQACVPPRYEVQPLKHDDNILAKIDGTGNSLCLVMMLFCLIFSCRACVEL